MAFSQGILFAIITMLCWAVADFLVVKAVRKTSVMKTLVWSQIISSITFVIITIVFFGFPSVSTKNILLAAGCGFLGAVASFSFYKGLSVGKVAVVAPLSACWTIIVVILSLIFLKETITGLQMIAVSLVIGGGLLLSFKAQDLVSLNLKNFARGVEYALLTAACWGIYFIVLDVLVTELGWFLPTVMTRVASALFLLVLVAVKKEDMSFPSNAGWLIIGDAYFNVTAFIAYGIAITSENSSIVAPVAAVTPGLTIIFAFLLLKERIEINQLIGMVAALAGILLISL